MSRVIKQASTAMAVGLYPMLMHAATISIGVPGEGTDEYRYGANIAAQGTTVWNDRERTPTGVTTYIRAGSKIGTITNSGAATLKNLDEAKREAEWEGNIEATALGTTNTYFFQARLMWKSFPYKNSDGNIVEEFVGITIRTDDPLPPPPLPKGQ